MQFKTKLRQEQSLVDLTPLVDVMFLLLIFFMFIQQGQGLQSIAIQNPTLNHTESTQYNFLTVLLDRHHAIYLSGEDEMLDLKTLKLRLHDKVQALKDQHPTLEPTVVLSVDKQVTYEAFLQVFAATQECSSSVRLIYKPLEKHAI